MRTAYMTKDEHIASFAYNVLQHAYKPRILPVHAKAYNLSKTIYYGWLRRLNQFGYLWT